jgi:putative membrane protein
MVSTAHPGAAQSREHIMLATLATTAVVTHAGPWAAGFGWVFFLIPLFWFLVIGLIIFLVSRGRRRAWREAGYGPHAGWGPGYYGQAQAAATAEATLADRYARGDIDEKEYRARLEVLRASNIPPAPPKG